MFHPVKYPSMKLAIIIYGSLDTLSGGYFYDRKLVEYLRAQRDSVDIISLPWRNYAAHLADNFSFRLPHGYDIIIEDELNHPSLLAANAATHPCPVVSLVHHLRCSEERPAWQNSLYRIVEKKYLQGVDGFIFNSQTTQGAAQSVAQNRKPSIVAYPPTDRFGAPLAEAKIESRASESGPLRILFLGNLIHRKGLHTLLDALTSVSQDTISRYEVDIVGSLEMDLAYSQSMQEFVAVNGLSSLVRFHGPLDHEPLREQFARAHVLCVPSSYEGFGIVYLEGMGFGLPAIGTTEGAAGEIIRDGETGFLVPPRSADRLAARLASLAADRSLLTRLSLNARRRYLEQPSWMETASNIRNFLQTMIK
jgi:glycosyltransferase involved in cell wall biosynthesis